MKTKNILSITEARKRIFDITEAVQKPGVHYVLTNKGRAHAVILSAEEYDSLLETIDVYETFPNILKDIEQAEKELQEGKTFSFEEVFRKFGTVTSDEGSVSSKKTKLKNNQTPTPPCGLCGKKKKSRYKTDCCDNWICDDENDYVAFSYSRNSCSRNHRRFTLCGYHEAEEHIGDWKTCKECLEAFHHEPEMYVWYGTNEYNFEFLENPPEYKPTHCAKCKEVICLPEGGFSTLCGVYRCDNCPVTEKERQKIIRDFKGSN